jgi:hypothetical protein
MTGAQRGKNINILILHDFGLVFPYSPYPYALLKIQPWLMAPRPQLHTIAGTCKYTTDIPRLELVHDTLNTDIRAGCEEKDADENNEDVECALEVASGSFLVHQCHAAIGPAHAEVCDTPEDEAEEAIKER